MRDEYDGLVECVRYRLEKAQNLVARTRVEVAGRFVGKEYCGATDERTGYGDALLFAALKLVGIVFKLIRDGQGLYDAVVVFRVDFASVKVYWHKYVFLCRVLA